MNLNMLSKLGNLICVYVKFICKILDICSQQKKKKRIHKICLEKSEYHNCFCSFVLRGAFTSPCLVICRNLWNLF